jgi:hypothetical protein
MDGSRLKAQVARPAGVNLAFALVAAVGAIAYFQSALIGTPRTKVLERIDTEIPVLARVALAAGDRFLAANAASFRAAVANLGALDPISLDLLARVHDDASRLNPAHADNYYLAQGTLPWSTADERFVSVTNRILERASRARSADYMPDFFLGINAWYFGQQYDVAGRHFQRAGDKVGPPMREQLYGVAASYFDKGDNVNSARQILLHLQSRIVNPQERKLIDLRLARLDGLEKLQSAAARYRQRTGYPPKQLEDLIAGGEIARLPDDPLRMGYQLDGSGTPRLVVRIPQKPR